MHHSVRLGRTTDGYEGMTVSAYSEGMRLDERKNGLLCPFCHGGQTKEKTFSLLCTPTGTQWKCWRNSCGRRGRISLSLGTFDEGVPVGELESPPKELGTGKDMSKYYNLSPISKAWADELQDKYGIMRTTCISKGWMTNDLGNLVIPLTSCSRPVIGHEFRSMTGAPKSLLNLLSAKAFPRNAIETKHDKDTVVIVEDSISALKVSQVCRAYSLQGTNLMQSHIDELSHDWKAKRYLLALDKDATQRASIYVRRYSLQLPSLMLCPLVKDLKNYFVCDIQALVSRYQ